MPVKQCLRRDDRAKLAQPLASQRPRLLAKLPALGVSADDAPSPEACPKHAVLGLQIVNRRRLLPLQSTGNQYEQELQQGGGRSHLRVAVGCLIFLRQPPSLKPRSSRIRSSFGALRGFILHLRDLGFAIVHVIDPHPELPEEVDTDQSRRFRRNSRVKQLHSDLTAAKARFFITCDSEPYWSFFDMSSHWILDVSRRLSLHKIARRISEMLIHAPPHFCYSGGVSFICRSSGGIPQEVVRGKRQPQRRRTRQYVSR
jgi:hypothetical protein